MNCITVPEDYLAKIRSVYLDNDTFKLVVQTKEISRFSKIRFDGKEYKELYNYDEPYERKAHAFVFPAGKLKNGTKVEYTFMNCKDDSEYFSESGQYGKTEFTYLDEYERDKAELREKYDSKIEILSEEKENVCDGVDYVFYSCKNKDGQPVKIFSLFVDPAKATMLTGTPENEERVGECSMTVLGEAKCAIADGFDVVAATNADFFDIHGDMHPAGLVIKNGKIIANENSDRPFFAIKKDGTPVISSLKDEPEIKSELYNAVCGRDIIMKDGKEHIMAYLEPFGCKRHPRTCAGLLKDGRFVISVVDSRIPEHSNGATMVDLFMLMKSFGAHTAINLDGGGSSTLIIKKPGEKFRMVNHPADLYRPLDDLIRDVYDSILIIKKR